MIKTSFLILMIEIGKAIMMSSWNLKKENPRILILYIFRLQKDRNQTIYLNITKFNGKIVQKRTNMNNQNRYILKIIQLKNMNQTMKLNLY